MRLGVLGAGLSPMLGAYLLGHGWQNPLTHCFFQMTFGFPGPGCGLTRSFVAMAQGDWHTALMYHLFGPLLFLGCGLLVTLAMLELGFQKPLLSYQRLTWQPTALLLLGFSFLAYYGLRLYVRYQDLSLGSFFDRSDVWQAFVAGARLL
jgi:hypothetical protein